MATLRIETPPWAVPLLQPARYKAAFGGRGSGKSWERAEALVERCIMRSTRAVCIREVQNSLKESVRQLIIDTIARFGLEAMFDVLEHEIRGPHGSLIIFKGMQSYNAENIKSLEAYDIAWVEEAQTLSQRSLDMLRPTIRKEGSEVWFTWNPRHESDPVDKFFRGGTRRPDAIVVSVNWDDNPWFPDVLRREMEADYAEDEERADHIWGGAYETVSEASYYARWISKAEKEGRIRDFEPKRHLPLVTAWDIGVDDYTSVWVLQEDGVNCYVLDYFEGQNEGPEYYVEEVLEPWAPWGPFKGPHYFPHDVIAREWGAGARTRFEQLQGLGLKNIVRGAATKAEEKHAAVRYLLPRTIFRDTEEVHIGISHLRRYSRKRNEQMGTWGGPLHDEHSHGADALAEFAINGPIRKPMDEKEPEPQFPAASRSGIIRVKVADLPQVSR